MADQTSFGAEDIRRLDHFLQDTEMPALTRRGMLAQAAGGTAVVHIEPDRPE
jgi:hypothetical protein